MPVSGAQRRKIEVLVDRVEGLPTLPGVACHLLPLVMAERPSRRDIQLAVEVDASLSARVVQLALELGHPPDSVGDIDAVFAAVPLDALTATLLSVEAVDETTLQEARLPDLWRHILATGMASQIVATRLGTVRPQTALLAGTLHDIGQIALAVLMPKSYAQVLERVEAGGKDLLEAERELFGVDHATLGRRLAQRWGFSEVLQNVIWLHHQAHVPATDQPATAALTRVVRLADLLARLEGFGYPPSQEVREHPGEVAERLGLSGAHAEQIGRQVAQAFDLNAGPVGFDARPSPEDFSRVLSKANASLGRLYRSARSQYHQAASQARQADLLVRANAALAACRSTREVLETVAATARETLDLRVVATYVVARTSDYVEGVRSTGEGAAEHFLYELAGGGGLEPAPTDVASPFVGPAAPTRAERVEGWLFERQGDRLGTGPFYTVPMTVERRKVGGLIFSLSDARDPRPHEAADLAALAGTAGIALKRTQAEADLVAISEELAEVNRELQAAQDERLQQRSVASVGEMAAGAAHEINNPLAIISGRAQQLAADEQAPARRDMLKAIIQQADRISDIIAELRMFAQPPMPEFQTVDPAAVARQVAEEFLAAAKAAAVELRVEAPSEPLLIRADPAQVGAAIGEIVKNAVQACSQAGGHVTVAVQALAADAVVRLVITDDGPGMESQVRARAFDPFYSGHEAGRRRGLGLPKAYRAVQANGGRMTLESAPGQGTTVRLTFRMADAAAPEEPATAAPTGPRRKEPKRHR